MAQRKLSHLLEREDFQNLKYEINRPADSKSSHKMSPRATPDAVGAEVPCRGGAQATHLRASVRATRAHLGPEHTVFH